MSITIEEIKEAFEVAFDGDSSPLNYNKDGNIENSTEDTKIQASSISSWRAEISFESTEMEQLVLNLPTICKMLLDLHAENANLKFTVEAEAKDAQLLKDNIASLNRELLARDKEIERLKSDEGYIYTVQFQDDWWRERDSGYWEESLSFDTLEEARKHIAECEEENIDNSKYRIIRERVKEEVIE